jgi:hypothetical protein
MNTFRKSIVAVVTTALISTSMVATFDSANAREMMGRGHGHHGHHHRGGGMRGFGTGMAVGVGLALVSAAIAANQHRETVARIRYDRAVRKAPKNPPVVIAKPNRECDLVAEWEKLVKSAEEALERDKRMHKEYGEAAHSIKHVNFAQDELGRRREELRKAKARCA